MPKGLLTMADLKRFDDKIKKAEKGIKDYDQKADKMLESAQKAAKAVASLKG